MHLWMFFLGMLLFGLLVGRKLYRVSPTRYSPGFWLHSLVTMIILLGQSVQGQRSGKGRLYGVCGAHGTLRGGHPLRVSDAADFRATKSRPMTLREHES